MQKRAAMAALRVSEETCSVAFAGKGHDKLQQADENVVNVQVDRQRGADVVGFAALNDTTDVVQDIGRENADNGDSDGQRERRNLEENVGDGGQQHDDHADEEELAHAGEVALADSGNGRQREE